MNADPGLSSKARNAKPLVRFRLYIAGDALSSVEALTNLHAICDGSLSDVADIEVVDVLREPVCAPADSVCVTPALIRFAPPPLLRIFGTLSQTQTVLRALGLAGATA